MRSRQLKTIAKRVEVDLVEIAIPVLAEAVAVVLFISACMVLLIVRATPIPDVLQ